MPKFTYIDGNLPDSETLRRQLREASEQYDPVDELLAIERELIDLEQRHGVLSAEFYTRFLAGEGGDLPDDVAWVGLYEGFLSLKTTISESLKIVVAEPMTR